jgi:hypothetical protein
VHGLQGVANFLDAGTLQVSLYIGTVAAIVTNLLFYTKLDSNRVQLSPVLLDVCGWAGRGTIKVCSNGLNDKWAMRQERKSPNYTIDWAQIPSV